MTDSIPTPSFIAHPRELTSLADALSTASRLVLDVEGDGFYRYHARLCTMQLAAADRPVAVLDTLAISDLTPLSELLGADGPLKVVHDAAFDARMLARRGVTLARVFDTAIAARFLGERATGLASLLSRHLGVELAKDEQQGDWGARPLTAEQMDYLVADVSHLLELAQLLEARLVEHDLVEEVEEESRYVLAKAVEPEPVREPWTRIRGARELPPPSLALLTGLADVREEEAEARDVPPFRIAPNAALFEAARRNARDINALRRIRGLRNLDDAALREAIALARRGPPAEPEVVAPPPEERARRRAREKALSAWRREEAERRGVNEQAVLPGHCLRELASAAETSRESLAQIEGFGEKRLALYADTLAGLLDPLDDAGAAEGPAPE